MYIISVVILGNPDMIFRCRNTNVADKDLYKFLPETTTSSSLTVLDL